MHSDALHRLQEYQHRLHAASADLPLVDIDAIAQLLFDCWLQRRRVFICGNGGSAGNANHLANDFSYGINPQGVALDIESLAANAPVMTCLANDTGYANIFAHQLANKARKDDVLIVLSGSGNSENIVNALHVAATQQMTSVAIVGYSGGKAKQLANHVIHTNMNDMQVAEDMQLVIGHMLMRELYERIRAHQNSPTK